MLEKTYQPADIEARIHEEWMKGEAFKAGRPERALAEPYCIVIPPPNVTGSLHIGHMLEHSEIDCSVRWHRMRGDNTLWLPGTDHAGISTEMMVVRQLASEGTSRNAIGREVAGPRLRFRALATLDTRRRGATAVGTSAKAGETKKPAAKKTARKAPAKSAKKKPPARGKSKDKTKAADAAE